MRRFNRIEAMDGEIQPQTSFEMPTRSYDDSSMYSRSRSVNNQGYYEDNADWNRAAQTVRRTRSLHRNAQQNAINFLPSRHVTNIGALGNKIPGMDIPLLDDGRPETQEHQVEHIVQQMEQVETLMEDNPDAEEMRLEALRDLPQCLTVKRNIRAKITASVSRKSKHRPIGFFKRMKYKFGFWKKKANQNFRNLIFSFELWYDAIKNIQGQFGSGVATYFRFLRWLFVMNIGVTIFLISFIVVPQALYANSLPNVQSKPFEFWDIFTGEGSFTNTLLYYGYYSNGTAINGQAYNIPHAYSLTMIILYVVMFVFLSIRMARSYRVSFIETRGGLKNVYANKIFCGWDFGISSPHAAILKSRSIYNELKELLSDNNKVKEKETASIRASRLFIKSLVHGFAIALLCLTGVIMYILMDYTRSGDPGIADITMGNMLLLAVIITVMVVFPIIFSFITRYEYYSNPRTAIFITLLRTFALEVVVVSIFVIFWLRSSQECWETFFAQEVYRLIIFDFLFSIVALPILEVIRSFITKHLWKKLGVPEFDIALNTLGLIYNQTLLWIGLFFSPLLSTIVSLKMIILFYNKKISLQYLCKPSNKSWKATQTETFFLLLVFMSLLGAIFTLLYIIAQVKIGKCGPFKNYNYIYEAIFAIFSLKQESNFFKVILFILKPGSVAFILIGMCVAAYYLRAKSLAQKAMVKLLREMLVLESKDKEFLLDAIAKVTQGHWIYSQGDSSSFLENSSTWKYLHDSDKMRKPSNAGFQFEVANSPNRRYESPRSSEVFQSSPSPKPSSSGLRRNYENIEVLSRNSPVRRY